MKREALQHVAVERCEHEASEAAESHVKGLRAFNASARRDTRQAPSPGEGL